MKYQDVWLNGRLIESGARNCEDRYNSIKLFCQNNLKRGFTVLDIGANMCYFGIRLIEDFNAGVVAFEFHQFEERRRIVSKQKTDRLIFINKKVSLSDLKIFSQIIEIRSHISHLCISPHKCRYK